MPLRSFETEPDGLASHATRRGRLLKLGDLDSNVQDYIRKLRVSGGVVNRAIVIAATTGIVEYNKSALLCEHGGRIQLGKKWADSLLSRMNFVKRNATKAERKVPTDIPGIKLAFLKCIADCVQEHKIPPELIINWDQTGAKYVPTSKWTLAEEGLRQVDVIGKEDKREMTVLFSCTMSDFCSLHTWRIYCGKTNRCHPNITSPLGWDVHHSENHWSTEATMLHFIDCVLVPYAQSTKQTLGLEKDNFTLALFDVFAAHKCESVLQALEKITSNAAFYHLVAPQSLSHWIL